LDIKVVAGIRRGGVIPGTIIAYRLGKRFKEVDDPYDLIDFTPKNVLLIDDVCDTALTLSRFKIGLHEKFNTAVLVGKPWIGRLTGEVIAPDFIAEWLTEWVVFPWERS
jgi:hypoxanthine phosphoribosyltransferase